MRVGIASDHGGYELKEDLAARLRTAGYEVVDFGAHQLMPEDDYPDFVIPLGQAVAAGKLERVLCKYSDAVRVFGFRRFPSSTDLVSAKLD